VFKGKVHVVKERERLREIKKGSKKGALKSYFAKANY